SGNLLFNPADGMLYVFVGDGGLKNGVFMLAQNLMRWNGKVLRIDVDSRTDGRPYGIPADNPFVDTPHACPEIWCYGLRNPWGAGYDSESGLIFMADVGQDMAEEINILERGGNYGWEYREGTQSFAARALLMDAIGRTNKEPEDAKFIDPIHTYGRPDGMSITGGFVYHGDKIPELQGHFVYGDWRFGNLWALKYDSTNGQVENKAIHQPANIAEPVVQPTGFYPDENGEIIVLGWRGKIFRME
ncbi:MAG: PQQ-dependent sugar dehydrogenase, partial [Verrucomicrobiota bacterium]